MNTMKKTHNKSGFSLIELLVVIAIIGLLAVMAVVSLNGARKKGRDAKRMGDIKAIQNAIELYITSNGHAPDFGEPSCNNPLSYDTSCYALDFDPDITTYKWTQLQTELAPYISTLPKDPCGNGCYYVSDIGDKYFFNYHYIAPGEGFDPLKTYTSSDYAIFAENLEAGSSPFGYGAGSF